MLLAQDLPTSCFCGPGFLHDKATGSLCGEARNCRWGVTTNLCIFLQPEPQHQPWAYSGGLLQEPREQGGDADAGGPGNVLIGELRSLFWMWGACGLPF